MKKVILAIVAAAFTAGAIVPAYAYDHHHRVRHKVKEHHHWVTRCR